MVADCRVRLSMAEKVYDNDWEWLSTVDYGWEWLLRLSMIVCDCCLLSARISILSNIADSGSMVGHGWIWLSKVKIGWVRLIMVENGWLQLNIDEPWNMVTACWVNMSNVEYIWLLIAEFGRVCWHTSSWVIGNAEWMVADCSGRLS